MLDKPDGLLACFLLYRVILTVLTWWFLCAERVGLSCSAVGNSLLVFW